MTVTPIRARHVPLTEVQILKNRYEEAKLIKDAWDHRLKRAHQEHADAVVHGGDTNATRRNLNAVEIQVQDAAGELKVALNAWMTTTINAERRAS